LNKRGLSNIVNIAVKQPVFDIRCEWGLNGITELASDSDVIVIVDTMSFCTCVSIAIELDECILPYPYKNESVSIYAEQKNAIVANSRGQCGFSLSPASLGLLSPGTRLVLPSPNGSALSLATGTIPTFAGCFRNAKAVAMVACKLGKRISVIPAGEKWQADGSMRMSVEDLLGAGAIVSHLKGTLSTEAAVAKLAFQNTRADLYHYLSNSISGKELIDRGFESDLELISAVDVTDKAPILIEGMYVDCLKSNLGVF
jgi:2-phosphosulfolactate phosphatase